MGIRIIDRAVTHIYANIYHCKFGLVYIQWSLGFCMLSSLDHDSQNLHYEKRDIIEGFTFQMRDMLLSSDNNIMDEPERVGLAGKHTKQKTAKVLRAKVPK